MPRSQRGELVKLDPKIGRTLWEVCRTIKFKIWGTKLVVVDKTKEEGNNLPPPIMANHTVTDYAWLSITIMQSSIARLAVNANTFEIKPNIV